MPDGAHTEASGRRSTRSFAEYMRRGRNGMRVSSTATASTAPTASSATPVRIVVDNSALIRWLAAGDVAERWFTADLRAPTLVDYEFVHALRGIVRGGALTLSRAREALDLFGELTIERHAAHRLLQPMWHLRDDLSTYDASYVALAQLLGAPLVTLDLRLARTVRRWCEVIVPE
ncbi:type II toxin-antitoxin system VapC family toxin [Humibacter ginsenosidimutans]|uniref:Ribonuclease VapC n=2 Tax=Humibacter ginsenosidimutans TaxID=2599293 RepID=A0A5B8M803_9MICO|nr:type II toxin-antitoxin system VapC family toxin [Humibacter ginsenosidimutans]